MLRSLHAVAVAALACAIVVGVYFRIADISAKTFFSDESFSVLRITGHTERQLDRLPDDSVRPLSDLRALQLPDARTSVGATLSSIGNEEPQRGPLYYASATLWLPIGGTTIAGLRSLAVIIGVLTIVAALPCGRVIFKNWSGGLVLAAVIAVSPFHYAYARQTREYGLLALVVLASATAFVWALGRERSVLRWTVFAASVAAGMLTSPLFSLVLVSFVLYVIVETATRRSRHAMTPFAASIAAALTTVAPWYAFVARASTKVARETQWGDVAFPLKQYAEKLVFETGAVFFDLEFAGLRYAPYAFLTLAAAAALIVFAVLGRSRAISIATALAIPTAAVLLGNDWRAGAHFATIGRYATPVWLGLEILVTAGVLAGIRAERTRIGAVCCTAAIVLGGVACLVADNRYPQWWDNNDNVPIAQSAIAANAYPHGIVIIAELPLALSLSHYLDDPVRVEIAREGFVPRLWSFGNPNMLFVPAPQVKAAIARSAEFRGMHQIVVERAPTIVSGFHKDLSESSSPATAPTIDISAANALWILQPSAKGLASGSRN